MPKMRPDPTFYPSPKMAMEAPTESLAYVALLASGEQKTIQIKGLLETNDGQIVRAAALDGMGILIQPSYIIYDDIVAGRLVPVLEDWDLPHLTINLAYPSRKHLSAKVRAFIDFMAQHFEKMDYERKWTGRFAVY